MQSVGQYRKKNILKTIQHLYKNINKHSIKDPIIILIA